MTLMYVCDECDHRQYIPAPCEACGNLELYLEDATPENQTFGYTRGREVLETLKKENHRRQFMKVKIYMSVCVAVIIGGLFIAWVMS